MSLSSFILNKKKKLFIEKNYYPYKITLHEKNDIVFIISIKKDEFIYESELNIEKNNMKELNLIHKKKFKEEESGMEDIMKYISSLIDNNKIKIEENYSKLIFKIPNRNKNEVLFELKLKNKNEIFKNLIKDVRFLKYNTGKKIDNKICYGHQNLFSFILFIILIFFFILYKNQTNEISKNKEIIQKYLKKIKILEEKIENIEIIQLRNFNLKKINEIKISNDKIHHLVNFPSGKVMSITYNTFNIFDNNFNLIQTFKNESSTSISLVNIKDENTFLTCHFDYSIKIWKKKDNIFDIYKSIPKAHDSHIYNLIYSSNGNLISCSGDTTIKIWEENKKGYRNIITLNNSESVNSILLLEDKNILVSTGREGTKFWNLNNYKLITVFEKCKCIFENALRRIDEDRIYVSGFIISISKKLIIKEITNLYWCKEVFIIEDKKKFLVGDEKNIKVYRSDNYELIQNIYDSHDDNINGFIRLNNETIASYSKDAFVKIWLY